ncbi:MULTISPECIES: hypothetical protein [unclassified Pseudomonas]|uniref:hypothetical protein n=1 Tax=unclassified Pseudomonas TaxID=196821 RepID=UPI0021C74DCD|nr:MULTISPECIES: hypothetical protein [unclassified Pseudomonas]MCU1730088.1 hypothetical protein [Pseudomonas sp. 20P_3.2_Bac4]MCU1747523.1 hypothetical protein [Pseudomonas sp. 20P_3.2_Bac5]
MSNSLSRFYRPALIPLTLGLTLLSACSTSPDKPKVEVDPKVMQQFQSDFQTALRRTIANNVLQDQVGTTRLRLIVNREGRAVACETLPASPKVAQGMSGQIPFTNRAAFDQFIEQQCSRAIFPPAPDALYDEKGQVEVVAPVGVSFSSTQPAPWLQQNAQRAFFRKQLLGNERVNSVGVAVASYQADAKGKTTGCLVYLIPAEVRPNDFKLDGDLQSRLNSACMKLDLSQMPGFEPGKAQGMFSLEYAPWTVGIQ